MTNFDHRRAQRTNYSSTLYHFINRMRANPQPDGSPAEHRWCPLFNAAKFGGRPLLDAVQ